MIFRPDKACGLFAALALAVLPALSGCAEAPEEQDPIEQARIALSRGDGLGAEIVLRGELDDDARLPSIAALLGEAELLQGNLAEAREWLGKGEFDPATRAHGFHMLARLELREGNLPAAGAAFDRALAEDVDDPELWVDIGRMRYSGGEQLQAIEAAERAVGIDPASAEALHFRGQLVRDAFGLGAALPWFEAGLAVTPDDPALLADFAATLGELGRTKEMLKAIRRLARIDPANPQIFYLQAVLAARAGKPDFARSLLQRSGDLERERPAAMLLSAVIDMDNGNHASAAQTLSKLAELQPENRGVQNLLARALLLARNESELIYVLGDIARRPSASPYLQTLVGRAYEARGDRLGAAWYLDQASKPREQKLIALQGDGTDSMRLSNGDIGGAEILAAVRGAIVSGQPHEGARMAQQFADRFAGSADALSLAGDGWMSAGQVEMALKRYRVSASVRRSWPLTRRMIMAYRSLGQDGEAEALLTDFLRGDPNNLEAAMLLAETWKRQGMAKEAQVLREYSDRKQGMPSTSR